MRLSIIAIKLHRPASDYPDEAIVFASRRARGAGAGDIYIACE